MATVFTQLSFAKHFAHAIINWQPLLEGLSKQLTVRLAGTAGGQPRRAAAGVACAVQDHVTCSTHRAALVTGASSGDLWLLCCR
jgi:hypothetical protein